MKIIDNKWYRLGELKECHPILDGLKDNTIRNFITSGQLKATNTSSTVSPRYIFRGEDIKTLIEALGGK